MATEGCWIQIYEDTNFNDNSLIVHGPAEFGNMRDLDMEDAIDSMKILAHAP